MYCSLAHVVLGMLILPVISVRGEMDRDTMPGAKLYDGKKINIPITDGSELDLLEHWMFQAVSSLMSAFASKTARKLPQVERYKLLQCSKQANSLNKHANCIMKLIKTSKKYHEWAVIEGVEDIPLTADGAKESAFVTEPFKPVQRFNTGYKTTSRLEQLKQKYEQLLRKYKTRKFKVRKQRDVWLGKLDDRFEKEIPKDYLNKASFHAPSPNDYPLEAERPNHVPKVIRKASYELMSVNSNQSPVGILLNSLTRTLRRIKNKPGNRSWKTTVLQIKQLEKMLQKKEPEQSIWPDFLPLGHSPGAIDAVRKHSQIKEYVSDETFGKMPPMLQRQIAEYALRKKEEPVDTPRLVRSAIKLGMALAGQNTSEFDKKTVKLVSPRFFSVVPEEASDTINLLSPSLLSLHDDGEEAEKMLSVPNLLKKTKIMHGRDQDEIINLIAEASGVADIVETINEDKLRKKEDDFQKSRGIDGQPMYFTKENATEIYGDIGKNKIETFERLHQSLNKQQIKEMNTSGYSLLNSTQLYMLYGEGSPYHSPDVLERFSKITSEEELHNLIKEDIRLLTESKNPSLYQKRNGRYKRQIALSPVVMTPLVLVPATLSQLVVLSPVLLSPVILSPAVLGPFVLSPWLFVPVILAPRVLSPIILSPLAFSPVILSPLVLHPFILSPGIFNPFILSPSVLTPFILSPQVATPFILSPMCLNPLILNPMAMSPLILSPFVLSPLILSPQFIFALVASPHALSPLIASNLTVSAVVASPSFLS